MTRELLLDAWPRVVQRWLAAGPGTPAAQSVLADVLRDGLAAHATETVEGARRPKAKDALRCEIAIVRLSKAVNVRGYARENRVPRRSEPVTHFCTRGWRDFANPSRTFDVWWYWFSVLGLDHDDINPLLHFLLVGRFEGLTGTPEPVELTSSTTLAGDVPVKRAFLYAGYDVDRVMDPYVVRYVRELSRRGDVFYLVDSPLPDAELDKVRPYTAGCWAIPHGRYDFGSYAMLARDLVGWDRLEEYDEVVFANDSCFALTSFDHVFERMDARTCDWWGFQASKRDFDVSNGDTHPIPLAEAKRTMIGKTEWHQLTYLHISSYFVALRRPAFLDPGFRRLLDQVAAQKRKNDIVFKYELGLSRQLLAAGHDFDTFIPDLYPFHPVYSADHFDLIRRGFPLLKRSFLSENSIRVPDLVRWKERVLELVPDAPVDEIEQNLVRVSPDDQLRASFAVVTQADGSVVLPRSMSLPVMRHEDRRTPKHAHWWSFPVDSRTHQLSSDARALLAEVADDPSIRKIVLTRSQRVEVEGVNLEVHPISSTEGLHRLYRSGNVFVSGDPRTEAPYFLRYKVHNFIHVGHPHPLLTFGAAAGRQAAGDLATVSRYRYRGIATGSRFTSLTLTAALFPSTLDTMWDTGCPRLDLTVDSTVPLPPDLERQRRELAELAAGRRVLLWAVGSVPPGVRVTPPPAPAELDRMAAWAAAHDVVIAVREDPADRARRHADAFATHGAIELTHRRFPHLEVLYGLVDVLVTDHSSHAVDFLVTGKPVVVHLPEPGVGATAWFCAPDSVLPSPVTRTMDELVTVLDQALDVSTPLQQAVYVAKRALLLEHSDGRSAWRLSERVRGLQPLEIDEDRPVKGEDSARPVPRA